MGSNGQGSGYEMGERQQDVRRIDAGGRGGWAGAGGRPPLAQKLPLNLRFQRRHRALGFKKRPCIWIADPLLPHRKLVLSYLPTRKKLFQVCPCSPYARAMDSDSELRDSTPGR